MKIRQLLENKKDIILGKGVLEKQIKEAEKIL